LGHEQFHEPLEGSPPFQPERLLYILGPIGVHPLLEVTLGQISREKEGRQPSVEQPMRQARAFEIDKIGLNHGREPVVRLASGKCVAKAVARAQCGRARRQNADSGKVIGRNFEQLGGVGRAMDFVENRPFAAEPLQEVLGIFHCPADPRKLAAKILNVIRRLCEAGLADSADASKPQDGMALPQLLDLPDPIVPFDHTAVEWRLESPHAASR
jgi:hypothetical protein